MGGLNALSLHVELSLSEFEWPFPGLISTLLVHAAAHKSCTYHSKQENWKAEGRWHRENVLAGGPQREDPDLVSRTFFLRISLASFSLFARKASRLSRLWKPMRRPRERVASSPRAELRDSLRRDVKEARHGLVGARGVVGAELAKSGQLCSDSDIAQEEG